MSTKIVTLASALWVAGLALQGCGQPPPAPKAVAAPLAATPAALVEAPDTTLTPNRVPHEMQVNGCELLGKRFGILAVGDDITFNGVRYPVETGGRVGDQVVYSGPNVRAVFTPSAGAKIQEDASGLPVDLVRPDTRGSLRIEVAGHAIITPATEHCVMFE